MTHKLLSLFLFLIIGLSSSVGQTFNGLVQSTKGEPIAYANIGVAKKGIGTITNEKGLYSLALSTLYGKDSIRVSCIGYLPFTMQVSDFMTKQPKIIVLKDANYSINDVVVNRSHFSNEILGYTCSSRMIQAGFTNNNLGYELGVLLKVKTRAKIQRINLNVGTCTYDSVVYRVNVYEQRGELDFVNILSKPIYIKFNKNMIKGTLSFDISNRNIWIKGNGLVTVEHIKSMGKGQLNFCGAFPGKTYHRKASQGIWETAPVAVGVFVDANVEQ